MKNIKILTGEPGDSRINTAKTMAVAFDKVVFVDMNKYKGVDDYPLEEVTKDTELIVFENIKKGELQKFIYIGQDKMIIESKKRGIFSFPTPTIIIVNEPECDGDIDDLPKSMKQRITVSEVLENRNYSLQSTTHTPAVEKPEIPLSQDINN